MAGVIMGNRGRSWEGHLSLGRAFEAWEVNRRIRGEGEARSFKAGSLLQSESEILLFSLKISIAYSQRLSYRLVFSIYHHTAFHPSFFALAIPWRNCVRRILLVVISLYKVQ